MCGIYFNSFFLLLLFCTNQKKIHTKRSASDAVGLLPRSASKAAGSRQLIFLSQHVCDNCQTVHFT
jgi:hypothetical protein